MNIRSRYLMDSYGWWRWFIVQWCTWLYIIALIITSLFKEDPPCLWERSYQRYHLFHEHYQQNFIGFKIWVDIEIFSYQEWLKHLHKQLKEKWGLNLFVVVLLLDRGVTLQIGHDLLIGTSHKHNADSNENIKRKGSITNAVHMH